MPVAFFIALAILIIFYSKKEKYPILWNCFKWISVCWFAIFTSIVVLMSTIKAFPFAIALIVAVYLYYKFNKVNKNVS